jgi:hypothetical protein
MFDGIVHEADGRFGVRQFNVGRVDMPELVALQRTKVRALFVNDHKAILFVTG